jgi:hypothetical protein
MAKNNDVFSIIPLQAETRIASAGIPVGSLGANEVGVFDYETGLSLDVVTAPGTRKFFIAMSVDTNGDSVKDEIIMSAGTHVQTKNVESLNVQCSTVEKPQIVDVINFTASCDTQYALKVELNNDEKYMNYGFNQLTKTFVVKTSCCDGCETCPTGDCVELVSLMIAEINNDDDNLILASAVANVGEITVTGGASSAGNIQVNIGTDTVTVALAGTETPEEVAAKVAAAVNALSAYVANADGDTVYIATTSGAVITAPLDVEIDDVDGTGVTHDAVEISTQEIEDLTEFGTLVAGACPNIRLTSVPSAIKQYCNINTQYYKQRMPIMTVSFAQSNSTSLGFDCNGTIVTVQDATFAEGLGYDLAQIEYQMGGFIGKPGVYRTGDMLGVAFSGFLSLVNKTGVYQKIDLTYDLESNSGWLDYKNNLNTSIVATCDDPGLSAINEIAGILSAILEDFPAIDVESCCA